MATPTAAADDASGPVPDASGLPRTRPSDAIDGFIRRIGEAASWLWLVLMLVIIVNVALRYVFGRGYILFEELQWHLYGAAWLLGLGYVVTTDGHVRIDVLADRWRPRTRAWIELIGIVAFLLPFAIVILVDSVPFVLTSLRLNEVSSSPGGLPFRWVIKAFITLGFALLMLAGIARLLRCTALLFGLPAPLGRR
ncbi:MAG TPA: TRAP transporter small permease subunit [Rhodospirillales bacterium]|nr:TRAP transporter small permease subunit [Rhodospirillales bacterium]